MVLSFLKMVQSILIISPICRHMICVECCQKIADEKGGREVSCPICRRDWTEWIYEHYPIEDECIPCANCGLRNGHTYACYNDRYGFDDSEGGEEEDDGEEEDAEEGGEEEAVQVEEARTVGLRALYGLRFDDSEREAAEDEAEDDDVPDITAMIRSLGRSYRSR